MRMLFIGLLILFTFSAPAAAETSHLFVSTGQGFAGLSNLRIGYKDWEFGKIQGGYGFDKMFRVDDFWYTALGILPILNHAPGFYFAGGFDWKWLGGFGVRGEFNGVISGNGHFQGLGIVGLRYGF